MNNILVYRVARSVIYTKTISCGFEKNVDEQNSPRKFIFTYAFFSFYTWHSHGCVLRAFGVWTSKGGASNLQKRLSVRRKAIFSNPWVEVTTRKIFDSSMTYQAFPRAAYSLDIIAVNENHFIFDLIRKNGRVLIWFLHRLRVRHKVSEKSIYGEVTVERYIPDTNNW